MNPDNGHDQPVNKMRHEMASPQEIRWRKFLVFAASACAFGLKFPLQSRCQQNLMMEFHRKRSAMAGKAQMHLRSVALLRALMAGRTQSVAEFARRAALSRQCIDGLLKRGTCRRTTAEAIAAAAGVPMLDLFHPAMSSKNADKGYR
ncbi:helix-turn-helix domain-containing protein [Sphaerimonospora cavernae]|uniref:Helix-turn-helix domain-containing protein n=1 Tax=Sphaerimonospora cavernae TaxID=1740611 RepID=A0ABV6UDX0_9ACTN